MPSRLVVGGLAAAALAVVVIAVQLNSWGGERSPRARTFVDALNLVDATGRPFSGKDLEGKPTAVFVGYTFCPDVCPATLARMSLALGQIGATADRLNVLFISIDPARDRPEVLRPYLANFSPRIHGLTGDPDKVRAAADSLGADFKPVMSDKGAYSMVHSSAVFLVDGRGKVVDHIDLTATVDDTAGKLKVLAKDG